MKMYWQTNNPGSTNKPCTSKISFESCTLFQILVHKLITKNLKYESISYNSTELLIDGTSREFQNQTKLFSRNIKSSVQHNPEVTVSVSYMILAK